MNSKTTLALSIAALLVAFLVVVWVKSPSSDPAPSATSTAAVAATSSPQAADPQKPSGGVSGSAPSQPRTLTLAFGAEGVLGGVTIKPSGVIEDSRCPAGVECVQKGTFKANVVLSNSAGLFSRLMEVGETQSMPGGQSVTFVSVSPAPFAGGSPSEGSYRLTFAVSAS